MPEFPGTPILLKYNKILYSRAAPIGAAEGGPSTSPAGCKPIAGIFAHFYAHNPVLREPA